MATGKGRYSRIVRRGNARGRRALGAGERWISQLLVAVSWCWLTRSSAFAQVPPTWQVSFTAPPACSTEQDFRKALDNRASRSQIFSRALNHQIMVSILSTDVGWTGRVVVESAADGMRVERTTSAKRCEDLIPALALMTALALDLEPSWTQEVPSAPSAAGTSPSLAPAVPTTLKSEASPPLASEAPSAGLASPRPVHRRTEGELGFLLHWRSVVGWRDRVAVGPSILWGSRAGRGFSPWARVSGDYLPSRVIDASGLGAALTWTLAQLDACTHKWALGAGAFLSPCARLSVGALRAKGYGAVDRPRELTRLWLTAGAGAELAIPIVGPLWLRVQGGVEALVLRPRIYVDTEPDHLLVQMPVALGMLGLGLGVRIW